MLKACSASEQIEGDIEHMIGFTVRPMQLKDRTDAIDVLGETVLLHHLLNHSESTGTDVLNALEVERSAKSSLNKGATAVIPGGSNVGRCSAVFIRQSRETLITSGFSSADL
jgi:hypothetical protein